MCIVPRETAGGICHSMPSCVAVASATDDGWNTRFPHAAYLGAAPLRSNTGVQGWVSYSKPAAPGGYVYSIPKSCSMEMCTLGGLGTVLAQKNPTLELPLVRRVLNSVVHFSALLGVDATKRKSWADIVAHLAPLPITVAGAGQWCWAESNETTAAAFAANAWYPVDYFSALHPGEGVGMSSRTHDPAAFQLANSTVAAINNSSGWRPVHHTFFLERRSPFQNIPQYHDLRCVLHPTTLRCWVQNTARIQKTKYD